MSISLDTASVTRPCIDVRRSMAALDASAQKPSGHRMVIVRIGSGCGIVFMLACMTEASMDYIHRSVKRQLRNFV